MTEKPVSVSASTTVRAAARMLDRLSVRHLPVVNDDGELVGIVSDRDLRGAPGGSDDGDLLPAGPRGSTRIVDVMSPDPVRASADDELEAVIDLMIDNHIGAVPIVDTDDLLVGIVSYVDVLRALRPARAEGATRRARDR